MAGEWKWHHEAKALRKAGDWNAAEEIYVSVGEQTHNATLASSAINSLAFSILIPQNRFVEARAWLKDSLDLEVTWETWNSLENLALCEYTAGNNDLAEAYLRQTIAADDGPVEDAKALLRKIQTGKFAKPVPRLDLDYTEDWQAVDVSGPLDPKSTQREFYLRLIKYLAESKQVFREEDFEQSCGASITGFANGILTQELLNWGFTRDAAAKACLDYFNFVQMGIDPNEDPYSAGLTLLNAGNQRKALSKLRVAARAGNVDAMLLVAEGVEEEFGLELALPWYRLASANGSPEAEQYLEDAEQSYWGDDEEDDDDDDVEIQSTADAGPRFCTNCGHAREGLAKFCTNCGTTIS